jgi:hypothetical protein
MSFDAEITPLKQDPSMLVAEKPDRFMVYIEKCDRSKAYFSDKLNIDLTMRHDFVLDDVGWWLAKDEILAAVLEMLRRTDWELALTDGDSKVILVRRKNQLILREDDISL